MQLAWPPACSRLRLRAAWGEAVVRLLSLPQRDDEEAAKVYEEFVKEFAGDDAEAGGPSSQAPGGSRPFVSGGVVRPGQGPAAASPASNGSEPAGRKPGGRYVPSFMPPGMAAAMDKKEGGDGAKKEEEPVFQLPGSSAKGKPRAIDALLANLKRWGVLR
jgi:U2-associated protein SR140